MAGSTDANVSFIAHKMAFPRFLAPPSSRDGLSHTTDFEVRIFFGNVPPLPTSVNRSGLTNQWPGVIKINLMQRGTFRTLATPFNRIDPDAVVTWSHSHAAPRKAAVSDRRDNPNRRKKGWG